jgi:itaconate CoA-transferase
MYAYANILAALIQRGRTGVGCRIDISMLESMVEWMGFPLYYAYEGAEPPVRAGASHATIYPYGPFPAGDGKVVMLGLQNEREWVVFCDKVLDQPALSSDLRFSSNPRRSQARAELYAIIVEAFAALSAEQIVQRLDEAQIGNARVNDMQEVWNHPQLRARKREVDVLTPVGTIKAMLPPGVPQEFQPCMDPIPAIGQHTDAILEELGYAPPAIAALREQGVV